MEEIWKPVVGYEGLYEISSLGRVKRLPKYVTDSIGRNTYYEEKILTNKIATQTGYPSIGLRKDGKTSKICIHKLIADAFIPNPDNLPCINHKDEDRSNSVLSNLERCTYSYNNTYGSAMQKRKATLRRNLEGKHKTIYQFTKDGELVGVFTCGRTQLEEKLGYEISQNLIGKCKTAHGYVFSYSKDFSYKDDLPKRHQKFVIQVDEDWNEIRRFKSKLQVEKTLGIDRHKLSKGGFCSVNGYKFIVESK